MNNKNQNKKYNFISLSTMDRTPIEVKNNVIIQRNLKKINKKRKWVRSSSSLFIHQNV